MWENIVGHIPERLVIICTILSLLIPYVVFKINKSLHNYGDPPWKKTKEDTNVFGKKEK